MPLSDVQCKACGPTADTHSVYVPLVDGSLKYPPCVECGGPTEFLVTQAPATDVLGNEVTDPILDVSYTSTRDRDRKMRDRGWDPAGDKKGGARNEDTAKWHRTRPIYTFGSRLQAKSARG